MAFFKYRADLANAIFPFESDFSGRTVIIPGQDQNYNYLDEAGLPVKDRGIPQAYYMHNVLATPQGYQSIGYDTVITAAAGSPTNFDTIFALDYTSPAVTRFLFAPAGGKNYIFDPDVGNWASISPVANIAGNALVTTANANGMTWFFYQNTNCYYYDQTTKLMVVQALTGLTVANVKGICGALGYMIAYDDVNLLWSSATTPTNFTPSLITGAGGGALQYADGRINFAVPITNGFIVYCERNAVVAQYTGNINFPWTFKAIPGSAGVFDINRVSWKSNTGYHYVWSVAGFQYVTPTGASFTVPEMTSFLAKKSFEDFNEVTLLFSQQFLTTPLYTKVALVAENFLVISYGIQLNVFTHALVFDISLQRWGKLKVTHRCCFEWTAPNLYGQVLYGQFATSQPPTTYGQLATTTYGQLLTSLQSNQLPLKSLAFLQQDGTILTANMDLAGTAADGVLLLGKYQYIRSKWIYHQTTDVETVEAANVFKLYIIATLDGKTFQPAVQLNLNRAGAKVRRYGGVIAGQNISHLLTGSFSVSSVELNFTIGGDR